MFQTTAQPSRLDPMKELKRQRTEDARDFHQELINDLGIERKDFNIKMAFYDKRATQVVGIFDSEFKKEKGFYFELVDREYNPLEADRKVYRIPFNEHYAEEYDLNEKGSYLVPLSEIRAISKQSVALNKAQAIPETLRYEKTQQLDQSQLSKAPAAMEDAAYNDMTIRDFMAIHTGKPVSAKPWLNDLIKQTYTK